MSNYRSTRYARLAQINRREGIAAYYRHKAVDEQPPSRNPAVHGGLGDSGLTKQNEPL
jgi:putative NIF3 family GTP cyclohydrolase 1 type 2